MLPLAGEERRLHLRADGEGNRQDRGRQAAEALRGCVNIDGSARLGQQTPDGDVPPQAVLQADRSRRLYACAVSSTSRPSISPSARTSRSHS